MANNNGNGNGTKPPLTFAPPPAQIPIIGQPFKLEGWMVQIFVTCKCEQSSLVIIVGQPGNAAGRCSACGKVYMLQGVSVNPQGQLHFNLGIGTSTPSKAPGTGD